MRNDTRAEGSFTWYLCLSLEPHYYRDHKHCAQRKARSTGILTSTTSSLKPLIQKGILEWSFNCTAAGIGIVCTSNYVDVVNPCAKIEFFVGYTQLS